MPSNPTLTRTSGITFMVMPPTSGSGDFIIDNNNVTYFVDDIPSAVPFTDDFGRVTSTF